MSKVGFSYLLMFVIGVILIYISRDSFTLDLFLSAFPIAAALVASYFWIRLDVWRSDNTIRQLSGENKTAEIDLISRRIDSRMALFLIVLAAIVQAFWVKSVLPLGILLTLAPVGNFIARTVEKIQLEGFK